MSIISDSNADRRMALAAGGQMNAPSHAAPSILAVAVFAVLFAAALLPVLITRVPAMVDYPNHLARMFVIARAGTANAQPFYRVAWALYPNLAMDLIIPRLGRVFGVEETTRGFLLFSDGLVVTGAVALEWAVKRRFELSGFVAVLVLYSPPFAWGFLNFEFALGVALCGIAGWLACGERAPKRRFMLHTCVVALLFVAHFFALGIYGFALGVHELWCARTLRRSLLQTARRLLLLAMPVLPFLAAMALTGGTIGQEGTMWDFRTKPLWVLGILNGDNFFVSAATVTLLAAAIGVLCRRRLLILEGSGAWLLAAFALLYLAMPFRLFDTAFVDLRVIVAAALILPAFSRIAYPSSRWSAAVPLALGGLIAINLVPVIASWMSYARTYEAMIDSFRLLKKGSRVLIGGSGEEVDPPMSSLDDYPMYNAPTLAVHFADAFVPTLFTSVGKQPIEVNAAERRLAVPWGGPVPRVLLMSIAGGKVPAGTPSFVSAWPRDFDYLYMVGKTEPNPLPRLLTSLDEGPRFTLYRIDKRDDGDRAAER